MFRDILQTLKRNAWSRWAVRVLLFIALIYGSLTVFGLLYADRIMFPAPPPDRRPLEGAVELAASDGVKISAVWLPHPGARHTILFSHGNGEQLAWIMDYLKDLRDQGFNVLAYDYRGYGASGGKPTEAGVCRDVEAAYDHLVNRLGIEPSKIILMGRSIGGGPSTWLAVRRPVGGLILESTFTAAYHVMIPPVPVPGNSFPNLRHLRKYRGPVLVIHGGRDSLVKPWHGRALYAAARGPKMEFWSPEAGHNNVYVIDTVSYFEAIRRFSTLVEGTSGAVSGPSAK